MPMRSNVNDLLKRYISYCGLLPLFLGCVNEPQAKAVYSVGKEMGSAKCTVPGKDNVKEKLKNSASIFSN